MKTTIIYVQPPQVEIEVLDTQAMLTVPEGTRCQQGTGNQFYLLRNYGDQSIFLFEETARGVGRSLGNCWCHDDFGWDTIGHSSFSWEAWEFQPVTAVFDFCNGKPILDSVTVVRPCTAR